MATKSMGWKFSVIGAPSLEGLTNTVALTQEETVPKFSLALESWVLIRLIVDLNILLFSTTTILQIYRVSQPECRQGMGQGQVASWRCILL